MSVLGTWVSLLIFRKVPCAMFRNLNPHFAANVKFRPGHTRVPLHETGDLG